MHSSHSGVDVHPLFYVCIHIMINYPRYRLVPDPIWEVTSERMADFGLINSSSSLPISPEGHEETHASRSEQPGLGKRFKSTDALS